MAGTYTEAQRRATLKYYKKLQSEGRRPKEDNAKVLIRVKRYQERKKIDEFVNNLFN